VRLVCRDGIAELSDGYADSIAIVRSASTRGDAQEAEPELRSIVQDMPLLAELRAFVDHLRGGARPKSSLHDAVATVRTITELRRAAGITERW
jgi:predicted dehydrogenase